MLVFNVTAVSFIKFYLEHLMAWEFLFVLCGINPSGAHRLFFAIYVSSSRVSPDGGPLVSFRVKYSRLQLGAAASAPTACGDAHAALRSALTVAVSAIQPLSLQPLAVRLALCALWSVVYVSRWGAGGGLRRDGTQQMIPLPEEIAVCTQTKASFA